MYKLLRSNNNTSHGRTKTLCKTDTDRVEIGAVLFQTNTLGCHSIEQTGTIKVHSDRLLAFFNGEVADIV